MLGGAVPAAISLAGGATTVLYYWKSYIAVSGVIEAVTMEVSHVVDAAGEEAVTWVRFAGAASRVGVVAVLLAVAVWITAVPCLRVCGGGASRKFTWIWPSPFAQAGRSPSPSVRVENAPANDESSALALQVREKGRLAREAFLAQRVPMIQARLEEPGSGRPA